MSEALTRHDKTESVKSLLMCNPCSFMGECMMEHVEQQRSETLRKELATIDTALTLRKEVLQQLREISQYHIGRTRYADESSG